MNTTMTEARLAECARFYGIDMDEARRRHEACMAQGDNPADPICIGCARRPYELDEYRDAIEDPEDPDQDPVTDDDVRAYAILNEGTYNPKNGHFLCSPCYIANGMPSKPAPGRWVCP